MTNVKTEAVFIEPGEGREFNYNKVYAKTLSEVVAKKLSAIESTTTVDYEMEAKLGSSVSWRLMQKLVALATRFDQFNSLPKSTVAIDWRYSVSIGYFHSQWCSHHSE